MLVKFEQVDRPPIWINPDHVALVESWSEYRLNEMFRHIHVIVDGSAKIVLFEDMSICVLGTPEEVVAKLFPGQQAQLMKEQWERVADSLASKIGPVG